MIGLFTNPTVIPMPPRSSGYCSAAMQRQAHHLHQCGPRAVLEALLEIARGTAIEAVLADYARLPSDLFCAVGADALPVQQLRTIRGGRP
jgi:hypothetical protein